MPESVYIGWKENDGIKVHEKDAFEYAKNHLDELDGRDRKEFIEWFFSGNWRKEKICV